MKLKIKKIEENLYRIEALDNFRKSLKIGNSELVITSHVSHTNIGLNIIFFNNAFFDKKNLIIFLKYIKLISEKGRDIDKNYFSYFCLNRHRLSKHKFMFKFRL